MKKILLASSLLAISVFATNFSNEKEKIVVFHAGSLKVPFSQMEKAFEEKYPQYNVVREASGSRAAAKKIYALGRKADVMASADYKVIDNLLIPNHAKFNAKFATNEMVIAYTKNAKYSNEITSKNWPEIFLRQGVRVAHSDPNQDPCGYRSILVTKLAQDFYKIPKFYDRLLGYGKSYTKGEENKEKIVVRPKESQLLKLIEEDKYDYLYIYKSVAQQHNLNYITLPKEVSLKDNENANFYKTATFDIDGKKAGTYITKKGDAMVYGITVVQNKKASNIKGAVKFVNFVLSKQGQEIMKKNGQGVISPAKISGDSSVLK